MGRVTNRLVDTELRWAKLQRMPGGHNNTLTQRKDNWELRTEHQAPSTEHSALSTEPSQHTERMRNATKGAPTDWVTYWLTDWLTNKQTDKPRDSLTANEWMNARLNERMNEITKQARMRKYQLLRPAATLLSSKLPGCSVRDCPTRRYPF